MKNQIMKDDPLLSLVNSTLIILPTPGNISMWWNLGSMLGVCLLIQIASGIFLSMHYCPNSTLAFESVVNITKNVNYGWVIRNIHMNGASLYFLCMYMHIGRGIYYQSYKLTKTWFMGMIIMVMSMSTAFMGYILPWGQMSYWGATVITNLMSAIPVVGKPIVLWLWGGFSVSDPTLNRFYSIHFALPFMIIGMVMLHLMFLHQTGSSNPIGVNSNLHKIIFSPYFLMKDIMGFMTMLSILTYMTLQSPFTLSDPDNFIQANPMVTPIHIQPEWYFLFAYAILRSIPSKLGGVIALVSSIMVLVTLPMSKPLYATTMFYPLSKFLFFSFTSSMIMLTWLGAQPIEFPFMALSQIYSTTYFLYFIVLGPLTQIQDKINMSLKG